MSARAIARAALALVFATGLGRGAATAQPVDLSFLTTAAEASGGERTSRHDEVLAFLDVIDATSEQAHLTTFGYSTEGRALPLLVWGDVAGASPEDVRAGGRLRVLLLGTIHAGEVAGKEALLGLARSLAAGRHAAWADSLTLLIAPIYNADGNERVSLYHRPRQHGPVGGMGQRPNAQGLDLNRDFVKAAAPETRSLLRLMREYDPHVVVDLHTTNGTYHAYHLTYSPPLHPSTPARIDRLLRTELLPAVTVELEREGLLTYYYGNVPPEGMDAPRGWYTYDHRPRFSTNYAGLRGRIGILSEAYAYLPFPERIAASRRFTEGILTFAHEQAGYIRGLLAAADTAAVAGETVALAATHAASQRPVEILMGAVVGEPHPYTGEPLLRRLDSVRVERMPEFGRFEATRTTQAPLAYLVPDTLSAVLDRLQAHGIEVVDPGALDLGDTQMEAFSVTAAGQAERVFQGVRAQRREGAWLPVAHAVEGMRAVRVAPGLGRLTVVLLEPASDDGLAAWGLVEPEPREGRYPILRLVQAGAR